MGKIEENSGFTEPQLHPQSSIVGNRCYFAKLSIPLFSALQAQKRKKNRENEIQFEVPYLKFTSS